MIIWDAIRRKIYNPRFLRTLLLALTIIIISVIAQNTLVLRLNLGEAEALRIGFGAFFTVLGGIWLGPLWGAFIGAGSDLISFAFHPAGPYIVQVTLVSALRGALPGVWARYIDDITRLRNLTLLTATTQVLCSVILMPIILYQAFGIPLLGNISARLLTQAFTIPLYVLVLYILLKQWKSEEVLQESEEKHRSIFEYSPLGIIHFNTKGIVTDCNDAMAELIGSTCKDVVGLNLFELPEQQIVISLQQALQGNNGFFEGKYPITSLNRDIYVRAIFVPTVTNGEVSGGAAIIEDISEHVLAEEKLKLLAETDDLTGLWNRRYFRQALENEMERARRYEQVFSLAMIDIDNFKKVNDTWGHGAGDVVLQHLSNSIKKRLRHVDIFGRLGGEEFGIILPGTELEGAYVLAEELRQTIENTPVRINDSEIFITISIGVTVYQEGIYNVDESLKKADKALYEAKAKGKNRTAKNL